MGKYITFLSLCYELSSRETCLSPEKGYLFASPDGKDFDLSALSADTAGQLDVFGHDGDTLGVDGAQVGVLEQTDEVRL